MRNNLFFSTISPNLNRINFLIRDLISNEKQAIYNLFF